MSASSAEDVEVPLTTNEVFELRAKIMAEELLLRRFSRSQAARALARGSDEGGLGISAKRAMRFVDAVIVEWRETAGTTREQMREQQLRVLDNLFKSAYAEKRYSVCVQVERLRAEITGTLAPKRIDVKAPALPAGTSADATLPPGFQDRSPFEYDYYATYGEWPPEEATVH